MERKIAFSPVSPAETNEFRIIAHAARHIEPLHRGLALVVRSATYFNGHERGVSTIELNLSVFHFGQVIASVETGAVTYRLKVPALQWLPDYFIMVANQRFEAGFSGMITKQELEGWLPSVLHVRAVAQV